MQVRKSQICLHFDLGLSSFQNCEKEMCVVETTQSMVFYYTIPGLEQGVSGGREGVFCLNWLRLKGGNRNML